MLKKLLQLHTPESLYEKLVGYANKAGMTTRLPRDIVAAKLETYRVAIGENYNSCKKLVTLLDKLFTHYS